MRIEVAGHTHVGMKRNHNEDNYLILPDQNLCCVADGMGGHSSGEIASKIAVDELAEFFRMTASDEDATWPFKMDKTRNYDENRLATGIKLANKSIFDKACSEVKYKGMGTTIVSLHFTNDTAYVGHVGDSRVYFFRQGVLKQVTEDHSLLNDYLKAKKLTPEEIENFPHKNVIVRALGMKELVQVDVAKVEAQEGDVFLLCSDGLSGMVTDPQMQELLAKTSELDKACSQLIDLANAAGGNDNVTCVLARYHAD
ncbi:Stp1/IreP family PP2C-type Ser/Thr phosphatase [Archangium sp.]|jgi:protein phosphatase|uniref:Stp1/IreP family PP2C-type Ser/Thr phosphatase n=1 Tax=Archangium sp. TaxID=1872627 RepID=UPI002ED943F7